MGTLLKDRREQLRSSHLNFSSLHARLYNPAMIATPNNREMGTSKSATFEQEIKAGKIVPGMTFNQKVWAITSRIPKGKVTTYAAVAQALGTKAYRAVGNALNKNPYAPEVPCHRVVGSTGALTGFAGGLPKKERLLREEGIKFRENRVIQAPSDCLG